MLLAIRVARSARTESYEPADHAVGRSWGGLTTKAHLATDGDGRGLAVLLTAGQAGDSPMMPAVLDAVAVPRHAGGQPRCNPDAVIADKAYSSAANRALLRRRRIRTVIPERADPVANRRRRGSSGGRGPPSTVPPTSVGTWSNGPSTRPNAGAGSPLATTSSPSPTALGTSWRSPSNGSDYWETRTRPVTKPRATMCACRDLAQLLQVGRAYIRWVSPSRAT